MFKKKTFILILFVSFCSIVISKNIQFCNRHLDLFYNPNSNKIKLDSSYIKRLVYPIDYRYFYYQIGLQMGGIKFANIGLNTQVYFQPLRFISITGGMDIQYFRLKIFSSSDKHIINTGTIPFYYGGLINLKNKFNHPNAYYLFAKKGISIGIGSESVKANNHKYLEIGIGKTFKNKGNVSTRLEASYQEYGISGRALSSYQAIIDYDLKYRSILLRAALVFHKY